MIYIDELLLQSGEDYVTSNGITIHHPTLKEIKDFGESKYSSIINPFMSKPYDYMVELEDGGVNYLTLTNYDIFLMLYSHINSEDMKFLLGDYDFRQIINDDTGEVILYDHASDKVIDRFIYEQISSFIRKIYGVSDKPPHVPNSKFMKDMLMDDMRVQRRLAESKRKNGKIQSELSNLVRFLVWNNTSGYNYSNIWDLKLYQFYEGVLSLQKTDNYKSIMFGIYSGNVDSSKINFEEVSWISRLKSN